ncbi:phakinin [Caloenas nicobarica]|uniref:phakinin n=1 Tax=Caloenas nicobarica TaxID=187106 RepID=UPI0032B7B487
MPLPRRRSSFLGQQPSSTAAESSGPPGRRLSIGSLARPPGVYVGTVPTGGVSSLGTRVSRRALGISSVFLQGLRSSAAAVPLAPGLEKGRGLSYETLNSCLVEYIEKVRALEQVNQELEEHIRVYLDKKAASVGSWGALRENWETIYHQVGEAVLENARLMLHTENIQACAEDFKDRYENEQPFRKAVEDEINSLYKVIDDANLTKMDLESQIESMKEELTLLSKTHEEDVKVLYKQLAGSQLEELDVPLGSGLDDILEKIRIHWERDIEKNRAETGALLRTKQQAETTAAMRTQEEELVEGLRTEFHETACKIQSLQAETESLRTLKRGLENSLYDAKHWHDIELQNLGSVISKLEAEMGEIKVETEQQQRDRENLLTSKQQLEKDIATYHCLLDGEQSRKALPPRREPTVSRAAACERRPPGLSHGCPVGRGASSAEAGSGEAQARGVTATGRTRRPVQPNAVRPPQAPPSSPNTQLAQYPPRPIPGRAAAFPPATHSHVGTSAACPWRLLTGRQALPPRPLIGRGAAAHAVQGGTAGRPRPVSARPIPAAGPPPPLLSFGPCQAAATNVELESLLPPGVGRARAGPAGRSR